MAAIANPAPALAAKSPTPPPRSNSNGHEQAPVISDDTVQGIVAALTRALARVAGLNLSRNGGQGAFTGVRLRGSESEQVLVLIDGVRVEDVSAPSGGFDFGTITTGGLRAMEADLTIPEQYGITMTVGDTGGPCGLVRALRGVPVYLQMARAMERLCPQAWMLNCSNPLCALTRVVNKETGIRALGVCHGVRNRVRMLADFFQCPLDRFHFINTGMINGTRMQYMVDTGASTVAIGKPDADRMGLQYTKGQPVQMNTANGVAQGWLIRLDSVRIGDVEVYGVEAVVTPQGMPYVLLGNSLLGAFQMTRTNDQLVLEKRN